MATEAGQVVKFTCLVYTDSEDLGAHGVSLGSGPEQAELLRGPHQGP